MTAIFDFILNNMYLYVCVIIGLIILNSILIILAFNKYKRIEITNNFIEASKTQEELEEASVKVPNELELLLQKMEEDINVKPEDVVRNFEQEQEDNAIISYQELVDNVKSGKIEIADDDTGDVNYVDALAPSDEPIMSISEETEEEKVTPQMVKDAINSITNDKVVEEEKKFKKSEFISPVFGIMDESEIEYPTIKKTESTLELLNTRDYNELSEEIKRQEEFLEALKEFRKNLS